MITGVKQEIGIYLNLFEKGFGKKMQSVTNNLNKNLKGVQARMDNFGVSSDSLNKYQKNFNLQATKTGKSFKTMEGKLISNNNALQKHVGTQAGLGSVLKMNHEQYQNFIKSGVKMNKIGGKMGIWARNATHGLRGFRMEMLGVMFFGMAMMRAFTGLFKTSMEWMGVMEILSLALGILFLPVAELLLEWALKFLSLVLNLSPATKKLIGMFALMGAAVGVLLMLFGTLALGIGSIILAFGWILSPLGLVIAGFAALAGYFVFKSLFKESAGAIDSLRGSLMAFGISGEVFDKMKDKIIEWYGIAKQYLFGDELTGEVGLITNIKNKIMEFTNSEEITTAGNNLMKKLVEGAKQFFTNNPMVLIGAIVGGLAAGPLGVSIGAAIGFGLGKIDMSQLSEVIDKGLEIMDGVLDGLTNIIDKISEFLVNLLTAIGTWIGEHSLELIDLGVRIAGALIIGISQGILSGLDAALSKIPGYSSARNFVNKLGPNYEPVQDFILQPGGKLIKTDPNDTIMGSKSGFGGGTFNVTYNITGVSSPQDIKNMLEENNRQLTEEVRRSVG